MKKIEAQKRLQKIRDQKVAFTFQLDVDALLLLSGAITLTCNHWRDFPLVLNGLRALDDALMQALEKVDPALAASLGDADSELVTEVTRGRQPKKRTS